MIVPLEILVSVLLAVTAIGVAIVRDLFGLTVLLSIYSGLLAVVFAMLGAADVAFTEAVVGAGVSTALLVALLRHVRPSMAAVAGSRPPASPDRRWLAAAAAIGLSVIMLHGAHALPEFGDPAAPAQQLAAEYIGRAMADTHTPNVVTAVLADYRGFDTLIETAVVLTGALACLLVLRQGRSRRAYEAV
jgi:multicomponent Na+:H+ antiporter subunit B